MPKQVVAVVCLVPVWFTYTNDVAVGRELQEGIWHAGILKTYLYQHFCLIRWHDCDTV